MFENSVLRGVFGPKGVEIIGWRKWIMLSFIRCAPHQI
jgi:hypothetical protein